MSTDVVLVEVGGERRELHRTHREQSPGPDRILDLGQHVVAAGGIDAAPGRVAVAGGKRFEPVGDFRRMELVQCVAQGPGGGSIQELRQPFVARGGRGSSPSRWL